MNSLAALEWETDITPAMWIPASLGEGSPQRVGTIVPEVFSAYVRILHPAWEICEGKEPRQVSWAKLATRAGKSLEPTTSHDELLVGEATEQFRRPRDGTLEPEMVRVLIEIMARHTRTPTSCWFGVWNGYAWIQGPPATTDLRYKSESVSTRSGQVSSLVPSDIPTIGLHGDRQYALYRGPISAAAALTGPPAAQSPNLWWPEDHAWCVVSEIDFHSTYVAGSEPLARDVLSSPHLEAMTVQPDDRVNC